MTDSLAPASRSLVPYLCVKDSNVAIAFYEKAFGAQSLFRLTGPGGKGVMHAELRLGDSLVYLGDEFPGSSISPASLGGTAVGLMLAVSDVDASFTRAVDAGATPIMEPADMFWGDRFCKLRDPFGHEWSLCAHLEDVPPDEIQRRCDEMMAAASAEAVCA